jgi:hypothetical protein
MMKRYWFQSIVILGSIAFLSFSVQSADTPNPRFSAKVKVSVEGEESVNSSVSSYLNRELRSLGDVELVDKDHEWEISVLILATRSVGGQNMGFVLSTVIIPTFSNQWLREYLIPKYQDLVLNITSGLSYYPKQWINIGGTKDIQEICKRIIANFDTTCLEENRKVFRQINSMKK